jgi:hypothetical protein
MRTPAKHVEKTNEENKSDKGSIQLTFTIFGVKHDNPNPKNIISLPFEKIKSL